MNGIPSVEANHQQGPASIWNRMFITLFLTNMAFNMGQMMSNSLLAIYAESLGAPTSTIGMVISAFAISSILFRLISAPVMDTYNRKYIVLCSSLLLSLSFWGFSLSTSIPTLLCFRLMQGCGMAFGNACCLAMVADLLPKDKYSTGIGYYSLAQVISQAIGPMVGLQLVDLVGFRMTYTINACIMLFSALMAFQIKLNFTRTKKFKLALDNIIAKEALLPTAVLFLLVAGGSTGSFLIVYANGLGIARISLHFTVSALTMLISRPLIGRLTDKFGLAAVCVPALFCNVVSFLIISNATSLIQFLFASFIAAFGSGACHPAMQALSMKSVTNARRGAASSTNFIGMDMGQLIGPTIAGVVAQSFGYNIMWRVMAIPFLLGIFLVFLCRGSILRIEKDFASRSA